MILRMLRGALVLATSFLVIPYTIAVVSNILHGWPPCRDKYKRALNPKKVLGLNYVLFQMLRDKARYIPLYLRWKKFYRNADPRRLYKNLAFGRNDCTLDVYLPREREPGGHFPVVIFIYGGAWSSGDKSSYGLLCSNIVADTQTVTVCPNYSVYPKGYVDDMIQDIVDCIGWVIDNIHEYGGDKNRLILVGHSAGAHLATMSILELLHDERLSVKPSFKFQPAGGQLDQLSFTESHYGKMLAVEHDTLDDSSGSSESFAVVSENGSTADQNMTAQGDVNGAMFGENQSDGARSLATPETAGSTNNNAGCGDVGDTGDNSDAKSRSRTGSLGDSGSRSHSGSPGDDDEDSGDNDSVVTVRPKDIEKHATLVDMCKCIKAFIGLAGVYSIGEHYQHEATRGVEDVSYMCRAHYGQDHFARFSPKEIIRSLGKCLSLPVIVLVHGVNDYIAPLSSTLSFAEALADISAIVKVKVIPECDHYEICLDLMDRHSKFYGCIMNIIMETVSSVS